MRPPTCCGHGAREDRQREGQNAGGQSTLYRAWREQFTKHRWIARWTLPVWVYVSVTGVIVYFMLYRLYPTE